MGASPLHNLASLSYHPLSAACVSIQNIIKFKSYSYPKMHVVLCNTAPGCHILSIPGWKCVLDFIDWRNGAGQQFISPVRGHCKTIYTSLQEYRVSLGLGWLSHLLSLAKMNECLHADLLVGNKCFMCTAKCWYCNWGHFRRQTHS